MRLATTIALHFGGPGSGCNPAVGRCGRLPGSTSRWDGRTPTHVAFKQADGQYTRNRSELHRKIANAFESKPPQKNPVIHLVAGGMASGKSKFEAEVQRSLPQAAVVNSDLMRTHLPEYNKVVGTEGVGLLLEESSDIKDFTLLQAVGHNNNIQLSAPGSTKLAQQLEALESKGGYKTVYTYVHRPTEESIKLAQDRARTATKPEDKRPVSDEATIASHAKARIGFSALAEGRETKVYDGTGAKTGQPYRLIYHKDAGGRVLLFDSKRMESFMNGEEPKISLSRAQRMHAASEKESTSGDEFRPKNQQVVHKDLIKDLKKTAPNKAAIRALLDQK